ncbi:hypothetical protein RB195_018764 [Necator americanus]|uniref:Uncharacterized protein n=1 Tax=Necator americanus TaxID=51031 RepID=A0ABR1CDG4_NECAM
MIRRQLIHFDALLDEENKTVQEAEAETRVEDTVMYEMRNPFFEQQVEIRRHDDYILKWMEKTEKTYNAVMTQVIEFSEDCREIVAQLPRETYWSSTRSRPKITRKS